MKRQFLFGLGIVALSLVGCREGDLGEGIAIYRGCCEISDGEDVYEECDCATTITVEEGALLWFPSLDTGAPGGTPNTGWYVLQSERIGNFDTPIELVWGRQNLESLQTGENENGEIRTRSDYADVKLVRKKMKGELGMTWSGDGWGVLMPPFKIKFNLTLEE